MKNTEIIRELSSAAYKFRKNRLLKWTNFNLRLTPERAGDVKKIAQKNGVSYNVFLNRIIESYFTKEGV